MINGNYGKKLANHFSPITKSHLCLGRFRFQYTIEYSHQSNRSAARQSNHQFYFQSNRSIAESMRRNFSCVKRGGDQCSLLDSSEHSISLCHVYRIPDIRKILVQQLDRIFSNEEPITTTHEIEHENIRGAKYYERLLNPTEEPSS